MNAWTKTMLPYVSDPFRGSIERRIISADETSLTLEHNAALQAIQSASLTVKDVDLMIVSSMFPHHIIPGNAVYLAKQLNLECPALISIQAVLVHSLPLKMLGCELHLDDTKIFWS
jgi:3-oxoacyl-[acyl-carrier-protein] synthase-3